MSGTPRHGPGESAFTDWLTARVAGYVRWKVPEDVPLTECGLDSVALMRLYGDIEEEFGPMVEPAEAWENPTINQLARHLTFRYSRSRTDGRARAAFVFTGQGCQHPRMTAGLHAESTVYRKHLAHADTALLPHLGTSVRKLILDGDPRIHQTAFTQPALFASQYALAMTLVEADTRLVAVLGHGTGEFAAAVVAGALPLDRAAQLVALRSMFMQYLPSGGGMMATGADMHEAMEAAKNEPGVFVGATNAARATVLSGEVAALERVQTNLEEVGISSAFLQVSHAFQSPLMEPVAARFETAARHLPAAPPRLPFYSTVYGREFADPLDAEYWTRQITTPIRFADAYRRLLVEQNPGHTVEIGPKAVLTPFVRRMGGAGGPVCLPVCRGPNSDAVDLAGVLSALSAGPLAEERLD